MVREPQTFLYSVFQSALFGEGLLAAPTVRKFAVARGDVPDELELKRELSDICHEHGVPDWQELVKALFDWIAQAQGAERLRRIATLNQLMDFVRHAVLQLKSRPRPHENPATTKPVGEIHQLLKSFVDAVTVS